MENLRLSKDIAKKVNSIGGTAYFVGGYVRDKIRGVENYDIDIEVHGISQNDLENILKSFGNVNIIGKSFGIYNIEHKNLDIALPRKERKIGEGHKGFDVNVDPYLGVKNASKRRDFTINAIMQDILTGELIDIFNGINDIKNGLIRFVNKESFIEDPLRVFRACQFASRFNYKITDETIKLCKNINTSYLSKERVFEETSKALLKSKNPSIYFNYLDKMGQLQSWFNELKALQNIEQSPIYHKEGNVYTHTMMVLDEAATYRELVNYAVYFMFAALCHDLGKAVTTFVENGKIKSLKHEIEGIAISEQFLKRLTNNKKLIYYVKNMVEHHMKPNMYAFQNSRIKATNKLFYDSVDPNDLIYLALADHNGRITSQETEYPEKYLKERYEIYKEYMTRDYVNGYDLISAGIEQNEQFSKYMDYALSFRLSGVNKEDALKQILAIHKKQINEK
ncbi:CCA tRNA nucleotidyltransferase [Helcococcus kunzii]|uniref:CCA tRNA nucleotidyltransferase n=1 Tax=Helcococcus kunzii TaxID=40091 RepID=UPI0038B0AF7F